jgi:hypothetical protein
LFIANNRLLFHATVKKYAGGTTLIAYGNGLRHHHEHVFFKKFIMLIKKDCFSGAKVRIFFLPAKKN